VWATTIAAIGSAAGDQGKASLFLWRLRSFLEECANDFGFDEEAKALADRELNKAPALKEFVFHDRGMDFSALADPEVMKAVRKAVAGKKVGDKFKVTVRLPASTENGSAKPSGAKNSQSRRRSH
jgi:hypothetical protein